MWSPWRMAYITSEGPSPDSDPPCVFCEHARGADDRASYILHRGAHSFVILNLYPYNNGHLMVVPYRHTDTLRALNADELSEMMALVQESQRVMEERMRPQGFNLGINQGSAAGAGIAQHLHLHLLPRWNGDTNFMPTLGGTRVMPQHLDDTYDLLLEGFRP